MSKDWSLENDQDIVEILANGGWELLWEIVHAQEARDIERVESEYPRGLEQWKASMAVQIRWSKWRLSVTERRHSFSVAAKGIQGAEPLG